MLVECESYMKAEFILDDLWNLAENIQLNHRIRLFKNVSHRRGTLSNPSTRFYQQLKNNFHIEAWEPLKAKFKDTDMYISMMLVPT